jgi:hypothetical protein
VLLESSSAMNPQLTLSSFAAYQSREAPFQAGQAATTEDGATCAVLAACFPSTVP